MNTTNKTALIIGGTSGMGKATAKHLLKLGATVIIASKRKESVTAAVGELQKEGGKDKVIGKTVDITDPADVSRFIGEIKETGPIDYLVNASGIFRPKAFLDTTPDEYNALIDINYGFFFITQAVAKIMKDNGGGAIVNIGSYWAENAVKGTPTAAYSMAKSALQSFTKHTAMELAEYKIRVNAIAPGIVETNVLNELIGSAEGVKEAYKGLASIHPLGRNGNVDEIANAIVFLLSEDSAWTTGVILPLDGGMSTGRS